MDIKKYSFISKLEALDFVEDIFLYGSRARSTAGPRADIDIAINCPKADSRNWSSILDLIENADTLLKIDCVRYDQLLDDNPLKINVDKEKVVLFSRYGTR